MFLHRGAKSGLWHELLYLKSIHSNHLVIPLKKWTALALATLSSQFSAVRLPPEGQRSFTWKFVITDTIIITSIGIL